MEVQDDQQLQTDGNEEMETETTDGKEDDNDAGIDFSSVSSGRELRALLSERRDRGKSQEEISWEETARNREDFKLLLPFDLEEPVIFQLLKMFDSGFLSPDELDDRVKKALADFPAKQAVQFLKVMMQRDLGHVARKSVYLCGQMKAFRYYVKRGESVFNGPDPDSIQKLLKETGYSLEISTGMRKYGGPPPDWEGDPPEHRDISVSWIPRDWYEDKLVPLFSKYGKIYEIRLMIDNVTGYTRNFCLLRYCTDEENEKAVKSLNGHEIDDDRHLKTNFSVLNDRLFIGNLPKDKSGEEFKEIFDQYAPGITKCEVCTTEEMEGKGLLNRGFCFLTFKDHDTAVAAKKILTGIGYKIFEGLRLTVTWYEPPFEPEEDELRKIQAVHVSNLSSEVNEDLLRKTFEAHGRIYHVQKVRDYAFVHYEARLEAREAAKALDGTELCGLKIKCGLSTSGVLNRKIKLKIAGRRLRGEVGYQRTFDQCMFDDLGTSDGEEEFRDRRVRGRRGQGQRGSWDGRGRDRRGGRWRGDRDRGRGGFWGRGRGRDDWFRDDGGWWGRGGWKFGRQGDFGRGGRGGYGYGGWGNFNREGGYRNEWQNFNTDTHDGSYGIWFGNEGFTSNSGTGTGNKTASGFNSSSYGGSWGYSGDVSTGVTGSGGTSSGGTSSGDGGNTTAAAGYGNSGWSSGAGANNSNTAATVTTSSTTSYDTTANNSGYNFSKDTPVSSYTSWYGNPITATYGSGSVSTGGYGSGTGYTYSSTDGGYGSSTALGGYTSSSTGSVPSSTTTSYQSMSYGTGGLGSTTGTSAVASYNASNAGSYGGSYAMSSTGVGANTGYSSTTGISPYSSYTTSGSYQSNTGWQGYGGQASSYTYNTYAGDYSQTAGQKRKPDGISWTENKAKQTKYM